MIEVGRPEVVIPSEGLPASAAPLRANNNLDACTADGATFVAWRTAPIHFASSKARLEVISTGEDGSWVHETTVRMHRDVREPRLVQHRGRLLLYFFTAGTHPAKFEPDRIHASERLGPADWSDPGPVSPPDHVVWRVRSIGGRLVMSCYGDASGAYTTDRSPKAKLLQSEDGFAWQPLFDGFEDGMTETDFVTLPEGNLLIVSRKESRGSGLGSVIGLVDLDGPRGAMRRAETSEDAGTGVHDRDGAGVKVLELRHDRRKFDSPALFNWHGKTYLVTRRQVAFGGRVEVMPESFPAGLRDIGDQAAYWVTPKTTALYEIDRGSLEAHHICDLPGCGDTAFASIVGDEAGDEVTVYNYSSPFWMRYAPWVVGQLSPTQIHRVTLSIRP